MDNYCQDILQEIPDERLPELKDVLKQNYPENVFVYNFIDNTVRLKKSRPGEKYITIYAPEGDFSDGTFLATIEMYCYDIFIYTMEKSQKKLERVLRETKIINWNKNPLFCAMQQIFLEMVRRVRIEIGHPFPQNILNNMWWLPKEKALKYEYSIPDNIFVAPLQEFHSVIMNEVWPHRYVGSEKYLAKLIEVNGGVGLFQKSNNELCAWVLKNNFGGLGMIQTAEKHKRKGYGSLIAKIFSKFLATEYDYDISGCIVKNNVASENMFGKIGFEIITPVVWLDNDHNFEY